MRSLILSVGSFLLVLGSVVGQDNRIVYTRSFAQELERTGADFVRPVEGFYKIRMLERDEHMDYDLVLRSKEHSFEMRYDLRPDYDLAVPHIHCFNLINSIAVNEEHFDIELNFFSPDEAKARYQADWAAYADFIPKRSFSTYHYGRLVTIFREDRGLIHQVLLFDEHNAEKDLRMYSISFLEIP